MGLPALPSNTKQYLIFAKDGDKTIQSRREEKGQTQKSKSSISLQGDIAPLSRYLLCGDSERLYLVPEGSCR